MDNRIETGKAGIAVYATALIACFALRKLFQLSEPRRDEGESETSENVENSERDRWRIATYNIRGFFDAFPRRKALLRQTICGMAPDILCCQEIMIKSQDLWATRCMNDCTGMSPPDGFRCESSKGVLNFVRICGNPTSLGPVKAVLSRILIEYLDIILRIPIIGNVFAYLPLSIEPLRYFVYKLTGGFDLLRVYFPIYAPIWGLSMIYNPILQVLETESIPLQSEIWSDHLATAERAKIVFPDGKTIYAVNIHLESTPTELGSKIRAAEVRRVMTWLDPVRDSVDAVFVVGDNNTLWIHEPLIDVFASAGFESAHLARHGYEPELTWPSGIDVGPFTDVDGEPNCLDFIWIYNPQKRLTLHDVWLAGTESCRKDPNLYPSDHFALVCEFSWN